MPQNGIFTHIDVVDDNGKKVVSYSLNKEGIIVGTREGFDENAVGRRVREQIQEWARTRAKKLAESYISNNCSCKNLEVGVGQNSSQNRSTKGSNAGNSKRVVKPPRVPAPRVPAGGGRGGLPYPIPAGGGRGGLPYPIRASGGGMLVIPILLM